MNPERSTEKPGLPLKARITAGLTLTTAAFLASCSGGDKQENTQNPTQLPETPIPTVQITPEITFTPEPTKAPIKKIAETQFTPTSFEQLNQSVDVLFQTHPDIAELHYLGGTSPISKEEIMVGVGVCRTGSPELYGSDISERVSTCASVASVFYWIYKEKNYEEAYNSAVAAANYILTDLPDQKGQLDEFLTGYSKQTSPTIK